MIVAIDFDGTIFKHEFPGIGEPVPGAIEWIKRYKENGAELVLWTMRSDGGEYGNVLSQAVDACKEKGIEFDHINENPQDWTTSPKAYANVYIDDAAAGVPLIYPDEGRPYVDWDVIGPEVMQMVVAEKWT